MYSLFTQMWACCMRARSPTVEVDESSQLLIPEEPPQPQLYTANHKRLRERLGTIVRSKEGKMINIGTPLPFNLHSKALHARIDPSGSGSSRSGARSISGSSDQRPNRTGAEPERSPSRASSPQPPSSPSFVSLQPGDASYLPPDERYPGGRPILNVRLANDGSGRTRRGRSRGRPGRFGEERGRIIKQGNGNVRLKEDEGGGDHSSDAKLSSSVPSSSESPPQNELPFNEESPPAIQKSFRIKDVGTIARSWRD